MELPSFTLQTSHFTLSGRTPWLYGRVSNPPLQAGAVVRNKANYSQKKALEYPLET